MTGAVTSIARLGVSLIPDLAAFAGIGQQAADAGKKFGDAWNKAFLDKQKEGTAPWLQAFTKDMQDARMVAARGGQLAAQSFLGGLEGIKAGNPQQIFNTMTTALQGVTAAFGGAGQAVAGLIPQVGPALGAAIGIGTDAMQLFIDTGGGYLTMLTEIGDKYLTASRTLSGSLIDHKDIDSTLSSIREIMASGAVDHFADVENSIGRFSRALNLSGEDLSDFTQMYAAAVELLGNFDPTNTAGIMRAFDVNPDEMAEKLQQLTNIVRDTGGEMGRIQDQMIRSGPAFRELGYGISETAYFFGKQIEEGERGTKLVYGINQMVDKLNKGVQAGTFKDLESGWRQMIAVVKDLDAAGQKSTALDILGQYTTPTNATLWLEEIRKGILLTPEAMSKAVQSYDQDIAKTAAKTTDLAGVFENISQTFEAALMPIGMTLASGLVGAGNQVVTWMSENQRLIADWGAEVANWFLGGAGAIAGALGGIMTSLSGIVDQAKWLIVESIQVVMNAVRLPLDALAAITPDFLGGDAIRGISDALNQVDKGLQGIQDSNWSDGFAKAGDVLTNVNKQVPEFQENLRRASEGFAASLDISDALKADLDTTRDGLEDVFKGLTKGQTANSPMMQLLGGPQEWATAKANMQALGLTLTVTTGGMVTAVTAANEKAQESWESWYAAESKKKIKVEVEATKDGNPISESNPLVPPGATTIEVQPGSSAPTAAPTAAPATPGWTGGPTGGKVYTTPSGATGAAAPSAPPELKNPSPYLPGTEPGATPSSATPSSAVASATPPATLPGPAPAAPAAPLAAESGYVADAPAGSPGVYPSVATVPFNEYSAPSPNSHPRTETWNKDYTQLLNETATPEKPSLIVLHSSEGNQGATEQAASMESSGKSYHFIVDKDGKTVLDVVDTSQAAKSVYDPGNNKSINIGMAGTFADQWGKSDWLARSDQLRTTAAIAVREAVEAGIPASIIQSQSGGSGIVGHDWVAENIGVPPGGEAHSDPGDNFPWAEFSQFVQDAAAAMTGVATPAVAPVAPVAPTAPTPVPPVAPATVPGLAPYIPTLAPGAAVAASPAFTPSKPPSVTNPLPVAVISPKPAAVAPFVTPGVPYTVPSAGLVTPGVPYIPQLAPGAAPAPQAPAAAATPPSSTGTWNSAANGWLWWQNARGETFWVAPGAPRPTVPKDAGTMNAATNGYWSSMPDADGKSVMVFRPMATAPATSPALVPPTSPSAPKAPPAPGAKAGAETQGPAPYKPSGLTNPYTGQPGQQGFTPPASQPPRPPQAGVSSGGKLKSYLEIAADNAVEATKDLIEQGNSRAAEVWEWTTNAWEWTSNFLRYGNQENRKADGGVIKRSAGGAVFGAGTATSDSIPAWLSNGEFVQKTAAVEHYGLDFMHAINEKRLPKFNTGGEVSEQGPRVKGRDLGSAVNYLKSVDGTPYVLGGLDCTQLVEEAVTRYRGMPSPGALWTGNQGDWLAQMGFKPGLSGSFKVGWGGENVNTPKGGHTAMTLPNGVNVESAGGSVGEVRYGRGARGATDSMFSSHASFANGGLATHMPSVGDEGGTTFDWQKYKKNYDLWMSGQKDAQDTSDPRGLPTPLDRAGKWLEITKNALGFSDGGEVGDGAPTLPPLAIAEWLLDKLSWIGELGAVEPHPSQRPPNKSGLFGGSNSFAEGGYATHRPDLGGGGSGDEFGYTDWGDNWEEYWRWVNKTGTPVGRAVDSRGLPTPLDPRRWGGFPGLWDTAKSLLGFEEGGAPGSGGSASGSLDEWLKAQGLDANKPALTWDQLQAAAATGPKAPTIGLPSGRTITPNTSKSNSLGLGSTPNVNAAPGAKAQQNLTDLAAGFQGSAQSAVESTVEAVQDPVAAAKALAPLINAGGEGAPGAGEAWVNVAKGMTHWDEWEDNPYGAAGGVSFDIGSLIYGGGAAATSKVAREATIPGAIGAAARNSRAGQAIAKPVGAATSAVNIGLANAQARIGAMGANLAPAMDLINTFGGIGGSLSAMSVIDWGKTAEMGRLFERPLAERRAESMKRYGPAYDAMWDADVISEIGTPLNKRDATNRLGKETNADVLALEPELLSNFLTALQSGRAAAAPTLNDEQIARLTVTPWGAQVTAGAKRIQEAALEGRTRIPVVVDEQFFLSPESWGQLGPVAKDMVKRPYLGINDSLGSMDQYANRRYGISPGYRDAITRAWPENERMAPGPDLLMDATGKIATVIAAMRGEGAFGERRFPRMLTERGINGALDPPQIPSSAYTEKDFAQLARIVGLPVSREYDAVYDPAALHWALRDARRDNFGAKAITAMDLAGVGGVMGMHHVRMLGTPQAREAPAFGDTIGVAVRDYGHDVLKTFNYDMLEQRFGLDRNELDRMLGLDGDPIHPDELERLAAAGSSTTAAYLEWYTGRSNGIDRTDEIAMLSGTDGPKVTMSMLAAVYNGLNPNLRPAPDQTHDGTNWSQSGMVGFSVKPLIGEPQYFEPWGKNASDSRRNQILRPGGLPIAGSSTLFAQLLESLPYAARNLYLSESKAFPGYAEGGLVGYAPGGAVIPQEELLEGGGGDFNSTDAEPGTWANFRQVWSDTGKFAAATVGKFFNAADELVTGVAPLVGAGNLLNDAKRIESQLRGIPDQSIKDYKAPGVAESWKAYASGLAPLVGAGNVVNDALGISYEPRRRIGDEGIPSGTRDAWKNAAKGAIRYDEYKQDGASTVGATAFDLATALLPGGAAFRSARVGTLGAKPGSAMPSPSTYAGDRMGDALKALDVKPMSSTTTTPRTQPIPGAGVFGQGSSYSGGLADAVARAKEQFGDVIFEGLGPRLDPDELSWLSFRARNGYDEKLGIPGGALATNLTGMLGKLPDELLNDAYNAAYNLKVLAPEVGVTDVRVGKSKDRAIAHFDPRTFSIVLADQFWKDSDLIGKAAEQSGGRGFWGMDSGTGPPADGPIVHEWMHGLQELLIRRGGAIFQGGLQDRALFAKFQEFAPEWANMNRNTASDAAYEQAMKEFSEWKGEKFPGYALTDDYEMFAESMADVLRSGEGAYAGPKFYYDFITAEMRSLPMGGRLPKITSDIENDLHRDFGAEEDYTNELLAAAAARERAALGPQGMADAEARTYGDAVRQADGRYRIKPAQIDWDLNALMARKSEEPVAARMAEAEKRYGHAWDAIIAPEVLEAVGTPGNTGALSMDPAILNNFLTRAQAARSIDAPMPSDEGVARLTVTPWGAQISGGAKRIQEANLDGRTRMPVIVDEKFFLDPESWGREKGATGVGPIARDMDKRSYRGPKGVLSGYYNSEFAEQSRRVWPGGDAMAPAPDSLMDVSSKIAEVIEAARHPDFEDELAERGIYRPPSAPVGGRPYTASNLAQLASIVGMPLDELFSMDPAALHWALRNARRDNLGAKASQLLNPAVKGIPTVRWLGTPQAAAAPDRGDLIGVAYDPSTFREDKGGFALYDYKTLEDLGITDLTSRQLPDDPYYGGTMDDSEVTHSPNKTAFLQWYASGQRTDEISMIFAQQGKFKASLAMLNAAYNGLNPNLRPAFDQTHDGTNWSNHRFINFNVKPLQGGPQMQRGEYGSARRDTVLRPGGLPMTSYGDIYGLLLESLGYPANELLTQDSKAFPGYATGGAIFGAGSATSDSIPAWLSNGEFVQNAAAVEHYGLDFMHRLNTRQLPKPVMLAEGGDVAAAASMNGVGYSQTSNPRTDCSGAVSLVINGALGLPQGPSMTTREDAEPFLADRGFVPGEGGEGDMTVYWYNNGPNANDGHMVMRLSNGVMFESGGSSGPNVVYGASPDMGPMTYAMHRPPLGYGQGEATGGGAGAPSTSSYSVPSQSGAGGGGGGGGSLSFGPQAYGGNAPGNPYTNMPGGLSADEQKAYQRAYMGWQQNQAQIQAEIIAATAAQGKASKEWTDQLEKSRAKRAELDEAEAALVTMGPAAANINTAARDKRDALLKELDGINAVAQTMQLASMNADKRLQTAKEREILANFDGPPKPPKGKGQQVDKDAERLGQGFVKGVFEGLGFGDIFGSDPTQWGIWKLLTGGLSYGMNLLGPGLSIPGGALGGNTTQSAAYGAGNAVIPGVADLIPGLKPGGVEPSASVTPAMATSQAPMAADGLSTGAPSINVTTNVNNNGMTTKQEFQNTWNDAHLARDRGLAAATPANGGAGLVSVGPGT